MPDHSPPKAGLGMGVDPQGSFDPSANVLALVEAAVHRLDDLRSAEQHRVDDLRIAQGLRIDQMAELRAHYEELLSVAESKRIDAIRAVDVNAVTVASERATQQASVLANQVVASADALRVLVASTATTTAAAQAAMVSQFNDRIGTLEKSSYVGQGRQAYSDPAMAEMIVEMKRMTSQQSQSTGKQEGISTAWIVVVAMVTVAAALFGSGFLNRAPAPSVVYVPEVSAPSAIKPSAPK